MAVDTVSRAEWLVARAQLLAKEKAHTQARAELAAQRRALPRVRLDKHYRLTGPEGEADFGTLFESASQLIVYHLMFGPDWEQPCIGCAAWADAFNGTTAQFARADARLIAVSRAPYDKLVSAAAERRWEFSWYSALGSDFSYDFYASSHDESPLSSRRIGPADQETPAGPTGAEDTRELVEFDRGENHGISVFSKDPDGLIYHNYSSYNRGIEAANGAMGYFDLLPKGRAW